MVQVWPLKVGPKGYPETSVTNYQSTLRNIPEERGSRLYRGGSLISRKSKITYGRVSYESNW
jgi:hypothetical protein